MSSEWMKVMLDEIARKKSEATEAQAELERREAANPSSGQTSAHVASGTTIRGKSSGARPSGGRPPQ
jgi:hypothetical protein